MKATFHDAGGASLADADFLDIAHQALAGRAPDALRAILAAARDRADLWSSEPGQMWLIEMLGAVLGALRGNEIDLAIELSLACPPAIAGKSHDLLLLAVFPDGHVGDLAGMEDAALLCLALLTHRMGHRGRAGELLGKVADRDLSPELRAATDLVRDHFVDAARTRFKAKLIIWGLDDTLWHGRWSDDRAPALNMARAAAIRALNEHGIVSAICAPADPVAVRRDLERHDMWDAFVFPRLSAEPRGRAVRQLIDDMLLAPANVLFIDGDPTILAEVAAASPGIHVANGALEDSDALIQTLLRENAHVASNRVADYRILEARVADRRALSDADFLMRSGIQATYTHRMDNLVFVDRIEELINRADPLNYTETRVIPGTLREIIMNVSDYDVFSAFVWDKYGHHGLDGLVGVVVYHRPSRRPLHLAFSCRIMHMGVEDFLMKALAARYGHIDLSALAKPLPAQTSAAITYVPFEEVREQILATQAPRDWSKIRLRVMSDCMSGGFHHYSRFKDEMDFDNIPRVFSLPAMLTGAYREQKFPKFLVYNTAIDYVEPRWKAMMPVIDTAVYDRAYRAFCEMVVANDHKVLLLLSPENASDRYYKILPHMSGAELKARDKRFNQLWRDAAARHPEHFSYVDLGDFVTEADMLTHAYHYSPSILKHMTELVDAWYEAGGRPAANGAFRAA